MKAITSTGANIDRDVLKLFHDESYYYEPVYDEDAPVITPEEDGTPIPFVDITWFREGDEKYPKVTD